MKNGLFENDVKQYGTQAFQEPYFTDRLFENDVKQYGTQALLMRTDRRSRFENDVKQYGTQADTGELRAGIRLRMM